MESMNESTTTVIDAGARYGIHPTWEKFGGEIRYFAFEPDESEAKRLLETNPPSWFKVNNCALSDTGGERTFYITRHRGLSSFLKPDMDNEWYTRYRPGSGEIIDTKKVETTTIDAFARDNDVSVDFLKIDTEGTELTVIMGAEQQLSGSVLGIRSSFSFMQFYQDQDMFSDIHDYLLSQDFYLLNIDYFGYGIPRNSLFRKPDPLEPERMRYGVLMSSDGVWLKRYKRIYELWENDRIKLACATLKYACFCLLNNAPDVAIDVLIDFVKNRGGRFDSEVASTRLYRSLRHDCAKLLGKWRVYPDRQWDEVQTMYKTIFNIDLKGGSGYWAQIQELT